MSTGNDSKTLAKDTLVSIYTEQLVSIYTEQMEMARHHETMRSNIATIFCTLATIEIFLKVFRIVELSNLSLPVGLRGFSIGE